MLINFPNQLTSEEEQLLKKIAKMKKKKKLFSEKKSTKDSPLEVPSTSTTTPASTAQKRPLPNVASGKQIDAKEAAKKLIQSGAIKFETENKEKGFKRSCSRKDDSKIKANLNLNQTSESTEVNKQISYSSVASPSSVQSPPSNSPYYGANKFSFSSGDSSQSSHYSQSPSYNQRGNFRRNFQQNQTPNSTSDQQGQYSQGRFQYNYNQQQHQQQNGVSLFIKANNVTEDLLRSLFNANVSQAKIISIDVKTNFAFVTVDTKEAAENAIQELNGKTFQESLFSVSLARPRKQFNRNNNFNNPNKGAYYNNQNQSNSNSGITSSPSKVPNASTGTDTAQTNAPRNLINYEDI